MLTSHTCFPAILPSLIPTYMFSCNVLPSLIPTAAMCHPALHVCFQPRTPTVRFLEEPTEITSFVNTPRFQRRPSYYDPRLVWLSLHLLIFPIYLYSFLYWHQRFCYLSLYCRSFNIGPWCHKFSTIELDQYEHLV